MAYDPATANTVLFGGRDNGTLGFADTWTWDGTNWTQRFPTTSPPARTTASMAYDPATGNMVLFGGENTSEFADTWTWDGTNWTQRFPTTSPPARAITSMAYDAETGNMVIFGGYTGPPNYNVNDTWTWDGTNWTQQFPASSPAPRTGATLAYDASEGNIVLFGGFDEAGTNELFADTWTWDGTNWTQQSPLTSPPGRSSPSIAYDPVSGNVIVFGGLSSDLSKGSSGFLGDTWTYGALPPPTTSVVFPSNGATLSGSTTLDASASNAASVDFRLFGGVYGFSGPVICTATLTYYGWLCSWSTTTVPDGSYTLVSEAFTSGGSAYSSAVDIIVNNTNSPPTTSVLLPSNGATLSGSTYLDATASIANKVQFQIFGGIYGIGPVICTATPTIYGYLCNWNTKNVPNGSYLLSSKAFNSDGNTYSSGVNVTVSN